MATITFSSTILLVLVLRSNAVVNKINFMLQVPEQSQRPRRGVALPSMCNINMKGGNRMGTTTNSSRSDTSNSTSSNSSPTTTTAAEGEGDNNCGNGISATMYKINTCSAVNCNPGRKSEAMHEAGECRDNQQHRDKDKDEDKDDSVLLLDIPHLQRLWRRIIFSSGQGKSTPAATSNRGRRSKSYSTERCDENLNGFYVVLVIVTFVCYLNGLNGDFVHDDIPALTSNKDVLALNPAIALFKNDFWGTAMSDASSHKSYRPLTTVSFR